MSEIPSAARIPGRALRQESEVSTHASQGATSMSDLTASLQGRSNNSN